MGSKNLSDDKRYTIKGSDFIIKQLKWLLLITIIICSTVGCQKESKVEKKTSDQVVETVNIDLDEYDEFIQKLPKTDFFAEVDMGLDYPVLLLTEGVYDNLDGNNRVTIDAEVYYIVDKSVQKIGNLESGGTAYPLCCDSGAFYVGGNDFAAKFTFDDKKDEFVVSDSVNVQYEEGTGNPTYTGTHDGKEIELTEDEFYHFFDYQKFAKIINFTPVESSY